MTTSRHHTQPDLFGQIPVTIDECLTWIEAIAPRWAGSTPDKLARYIITWDVPSKVAHAKAAGNWPPNSTDLLNDQ